jgi:hypothetical protein
MTNHQPVNKDKKKNVSQLSLAFRPSSLLNSVARRGLYHTWSVEMQLNKIVLWQLSTSAGETATKSARQLFYSPTDFKAINKLLLYILKAVSVPARKLLQFYIHFFY